MGTPPLLWDPVWVTHSRYTACIFTKQDNYIRVCECTIISKPTLWDSVSKINGFARTITNKPQNVQDKHTQCATQNRNSWDMLQSDEKRICFLLSKSISLNTTEGVYWLSLLLGLCLWAAARYRHYRLYIGCCKRLTALTHIFLFK